MKHSLATKGLSMSQAQTISNLCNQASKDFLAILATSNNCSKVVAFRDKSLVQQKGVPIPTTIIDQLQDIGRYAACQAFLMENIKAKDALLFSIKTQPFITELVQPEYPELKKADLLKSVDELWGWNQLSVNEAATFWEAEAMAAHIGQFIHRGGKLDVLRKELPSLPSLEWMTTAGSNSESFPITITAHHTTTQLWDLHQDLANIHREYEQQVNYFKAKVKNLVTLENARIANENGQAEAKVNEENNNLINDYKAAVADYNGKIREEEQKFESDRMNKMKEAAALKIQVDARFQKVIDELMPKESGEKQDIQK